jgi:hypothetical protein
MLFILIATVLAVFKIEKAVDDDGNIVEPSLEYTSGFLRYGTFCTKCKSGNRDTTLTLLQSSEAFQMQADTTLARSGRFDPVDGAGHAVISFGSEVRWDY